MDDRGLSWILAEYNGLWTMVDYHGLSWIMDYHGLAWLEGLIMNYGLSWILKCAPPWHGLQDMRPKPLTTSKRYGAGMAHTVASIGHVLSCFYCGLLRIAMDY